MTSWMCNVNAFPLRQRLVTAGRVCLSVGMSAPAKPDSAKRDEIVVFIVHRETKCAECGEELFKGRWIRLENQRALCMACADLDHLEFLPSGDAALTRRASKHSPLRAVIVEWSRARKRYERQGVLVTPAAIERAEKECLDDADFRERKRVRAALRREDVDAAYVADVAAALRAQFPGCPADEAARIAGWTCEKRSGRIGRSAAAKEFDPQALRLAVVAHIRHEHSQYDELLMRGIERDEARERVRDEIDDVLRKWEM